MTEWINEQVTEQILLYFWTFSIITDEWMENGNTAVLSELLITIGQFPLTISYVQLKNYNNFSLTLYTNYVLYPPVWECVCLIFLWFLVVLLLHFLPLIVLNKNILNLGLILFISNFIWSELKFQLLFLLSSLALLDLMDFGIMVYRLILKREILFGCSVLGFYCYVLGDDFFPIFSNF